MRVCDAVKHAAHTLQTSKWKLQEHMREVGFDPRRPIPFAATKTAVESLMQEPCCGKIGATFMEARLRTEFGLITTKVDIQRAIKELDPDGSRKRAKAAAKIRRPYRVRGPRDLYHLDAHEKVAKLHGMWVHGCVDGYSRKLIYLRAANNKRAETVQKIFLQGFCLQGLIMCYLDLTIMWCRNARPWLGV